MHDDQLDWNEFWEGWVAETTIFNTYYLFKRWLE